MGWGRRWPDNVKMGVNVPSFLFVTLFAIQYLVVLSYPMPFERHVQQRPTTRHFSRSFRQILSTDVDLVGNKNGLRKVNTGSNKITFDRPTLQHQRRKPLNFFSNNLFSSQPVAPPQPPPIHNFESGHNYERKNYDPIEPRRKPLSTSNFFSQRQKPTIPQQSIPEEYEDYANDQTERLTARRKPLSYSRFMPNVQEPIDHHRYDGYDVYGRNIKNDVATRRRPLTYSNSNPVTQPQQFIPNQPNEDYGNYLNYEKSHRRALLSSEFPQNSKQDVTQQSTNYYDNGKILGSAYRKPLFYGFIPTKEVVPTHNAPVVDFDDFETQDRSSRMGNRKPLAVNAKSVPFETSISELENSDNDGKNTDASDSTGLKSSVSKNFGGSVQPPVIHAPPDDYGNDPDASHPIAAEVTSRFKRGLKSQLLQQTSEMESGRMIKNKGKSLVQGKNDDNSEEKKVENTMDYKNYRNVLKSRIKNKNTNLENEPKNKGGNQKKSEKDSNEFLTSEYDSDENENSTLPEMSRGNLNSINGMRVDVEEDKLRGQTQRLVIWLRNRLRKRLGKVAELEHQMTTEQKVLKSLNSTIQGTYAERQKEIKLKLDRQKALKQFHASVAEEGSDGELSAIEKEKSRLSEDLARVTRTYETLAQVDKDLRRRLQTAGVSHWLHARGREYMPETAVGVLSKSAQILGPVASGLERVYDLDAKAANFVPRAVRVEKSIFGKVISDTIMLLPLLPLLFFACRARRVIVGRVSTIHIILFTSAALAGQSAFLAIAIGLSFIPSTPPVVALASILLLVTLFITQGALTLVAVARNSRTMESEVAEMGLLMAVSVHFWRHVFTPAMALTEMTTETNIPANNPIIPSTAGAVALIAYTAVFALIAQCKRSLLGWRSPFDEHVAMVGASISTWTNETLTAIRNVFSDPKEREREREREKERERERERELNEIEVKHRDIAHDDDTSSSMSSNLTSSDSTLTNSVVTGHSDVEDYDDNDSDTRTDIAQTRGGTMNPYGYPHVQTHHTQPATAKATNGNTGMVTAGEEGGSGFLGTTAAPPATTIPSKDLSTHATANQHNSNADSARAAALVAAASSRYARWNGPNAWSIRHNNGQANSPLPWNDTEVHGHVAMARSSRFARHVQAQQQQVGTNGEEPTENRSGN